MHEQFHSFPYYGEIINSIDVNLNMLFCSLIICCMSNPTFNFNLYVQSMLLPVTVNYNKASCKVRICFCVFQPPLIYYREPVPNITALALNNNYIINFAAHEMTQVHAILLAIMLNKYKNMNKKRRTIIGLLKYAVKIQILF